MTMLPPEPNAKDPISANWMRALLRYVRAITPIAGPGTRLSRGPNGTVISASPAPSPAAAAVRPWTFRRHEDEEGEVSGGWHEQIVQIGYQVIRHAKPEDGFKDETGQEDGKHYLEIHLAEPTKNEIKRVDAEEDVPASEYDKGIVRVYLGTVEEGKQTDGIHWPPVVYHYV